MQQRLQLILNGAAVHRCQTKAFTGHRCRGVSALQQPAVETWACRTVLAVLHACAWATAPCGNSCTRLRTSCMCVGPGALWHLAGQCPCVHAVRKQWVHKGVSGVGPLPRCGLYRITEASKRVCSLIASVDWRTWPMVCSQHKGRVIALEQFVAGSQLTMRIICHLKRTEHHKHDPHVDEAGQQYLGQSCSSLVLLWQMAALLPCGEDLRCLAERTCVVVNLGRLHSVSAAECNPGDFSDSQSVWKCTWTLRLTESPHRARSAQCMYSLPTMAQHKRAVNVIV
jgi:hypothetical protein